MLLEVNYNVVIQALRKKEVGTIATLRDVAREAGVSTSTVSHVNNGYTNIKAETRDRVLAAIERLDYHVDSAARALVRKRSGLVGVVFFGECVVHPFFHRVIQGVVNAVEASDRDVIISIIPYAAQEAAFIKRLRERRLEGIVAMGLTENHPMVPLLMGSGTPVMFVDAAIEGPTAGNIRSDNRAGSFSAADHLLRLGHRRIGLVNELSDAVIFAERQQGYKEALEAWGCPWDGSIVFQAGNTVQEGEAIAGPILTTGVTAVMTFSDQVAIGVMDGVRGAGLVVPDDISVVGFDDIDLSAHVTPSLTTVRQHGTAMGRRAVEELGMMVSSGVYKPRTVIVETELVVRASTGPKPPR